MGKKRNKSKKKNPLNGLSTNQIAKKFATDLTNKQTKAEKYFKKLLTNLKIKFIFQKVHHREKSFIIIDFYIPAKRLCIELDGGYHKEQVEKDAERDLYLQKKGFSTWRMTNEEALAMTKEVLNQTMILIPDMEIKKSIRIAAPAEETYFPKTNHKFRYLGSGFHTILTKAPKPKKRSKKAKFKPIKKDYPIVDGIKENKLRRERLSSL